MVVVILEVVEVLVIILIIWQDAQYPDGGCCSSISGIWPDTCYRYVWCLQHRLRSRQTHHVGKNVRIRAHRR